MAPRQALRSRDHKLKPAPLLSAPAITWAAEVVMPMTATVKPEDDAAKFGRQSNVPFGGKCKSGEHPGKCDCQRQQGRGQSETFVCGQTPLRQGQ